MSVRGIDLSEWFKSQRKTSGNLKKLLQDRIDKYEQIEYAWKEQLELLKNVAHKAALLRGALKR